MSKSHAPRIEFGLAGMAKKDCPNKMNCLYPDQSTTICRQQCAICTLLQRIVELLEQRK